MLASVPPTIILPTVFAVETLHGQSGDIMFQGCTTENVQEVRASTTAVLRKAIGYKDQALENITDFSHFRLYFICETSFLSLKQNVNDDEEKDDDKKTNKKTSNIQDIGRLIASMD